MNLSAQISADAPAPTLNVIASQGGNNLTSDEDAVSLRLHDLTDAEIEAHIESCGRLMVAAYHRYEASSCFSDRGEADHWLGLQLKAIKARRPGYVASLELARGLRA